VKKDSPEDDQRRVIFDDDTLHGPRPGDMFQLEGNPCLVFVKSTVAKHQVPVRYPSNIHGRRVTYNEEDDKEPFYNDLAFSNASTSLANPVKINPAKRHCRSFNVHRGHRITGRNTRIFLLLG
jgi:hypothetical protein